jgi:hypothetical protein
MHLGIHRMLTQRVRLSETRRPVAELQFALPKTEGHIEETSHAMGMACLFRQALPQNHIAAAFAMRGLCLREAAHAFETTRSRRDTPSSENRKLVLERRGFVDFCRSPLATGQMTVRGASETKFEPIAHCAEVLIARLARNAYKIWHAVSFPLANLACSVTYFGKACRDIWRTKKSLT